MKLKKPPPIWLTGRTGKQPQGYVLAADREDAFATVDHPFAEVFEADSAMPWPGHAGERVVWITRPLPPELGINRR